MQLNKVDDIDGLEESLLKSQGKLDVSTMETKSEGVLSHIYGLFSLSLVKSTLLLWSILFSNAFGYYGVVLLSSQLSGGSGDFTSEAMHLMTSNDSSL